VATSNSNGNNYQLLKTSRVTEVGTAFDTSTDTTTATDSETVAATATYGFMRKP
jgi:hypothetical protein